ncbi:MAG TPA: acyltransferase [Steroidobacteraceae bacterium]|jgi:peptidoglycan/LPS O-acetylase OafA/YrhL
MNRSLSLFLDFSRWSAAFLVVLGHTAHFLIVGSAGAAAPGVGTDVLYLVTSLGHCAVMVFFVISGYLVGGITLNRWLKSGPDLTDYAISRFARIYTVLVPALTIGYAIDYVGMHWFDHAGLYENVSQYHIGSLDDVGMRLNAMTYIGNLLMLQGTWVTSLGSNGPLWSLAYEWWYYCLFSFSAAALLYKGWLRAILISFLVILILMLPVTMLMWMSIWFMGVGAFFLSRRTSFSLDPRIGSAIFAAAIIVSLSAQNADMLDPRTVWVAFGRDFLVGCGYCVALLSFSKASRALPFEHFHRWAAGFSYSIYLFHFPVLLLIVAMGERHLGWHVLEQPSLVSVGRVAVVVAIVYAVGYLFSMYTERRTDAIRDFLRKQTARLPAFTR